MIDEELNSQFASSALMPVPALDSAEEARSEAARGMPPLMLTWFRDIFVAVIIAFFIITFLYQQVKVEGTSMQPQLRDQDHLIINKFIYRFEKISRGDVVVFYYPRDPSQSYIKRVIAVPGDDFRIDRGVVYVNGEQIPEAYVPSQYEDERSVPDSVIPAGEYFMMGDHRSISSDSRDFGPVKRSLIYGKAAFVYWPGSDAGVVR